ncbi:MAG: tRNA uridine-5-carboxymethylaminomethyl(34) synthesis GTPase MnmE, partial [Verrucomicrobia bacterium]
MSSPQDTIAALCTPPGEAGLAVIRVSGPQAFAVTDRCFEPLGRAHRKPSDCPSHRLLYGRIVHDGRTADEVLVAVFRKPHSYTGEDTVE